MFITIMDYSTTSIAKLEWDVPSATNEEVESMLESAGYRMSQISYMTSDEEPDNGGVVEVSDLLPDFTITKQRNEK